MAYSDWVKSNESFCSYFLTEVDDFQVLRNYLISKNISVNTSIIWLSHQVKLLN